MMGMYLVTIETSLSPRKQAIKYRHITCAHNHK